MKEISLYIHIPFCIKKCDYCDFNSGSDLSFVSDYIGALLKEMRSCKSRDYKAKTVYIGGGTPTVLEPLQLALITEGIHANFNVKPDAEFTVEANPGTLNKDKLKVLKAQGVNRISLGLQAYQDRLLRRLGRIHSVKDFEDSFCLLREMGFSNINADTMFGLPGQNLRDFEYTLEKLILLSPEHISCYSLIIEEGTRFFKLHEEGKLALPSEDDERSMYHNAHSFLTKGGFRHYEISNFAKPGKESLHNLAYWRCEEYLGLGAGSHSYIDGERFYNIPSTSDYIKAICNDLSPAADIQNINREQMQSEYCFMGLRLLNGLDKNDFHQRFGQDIKEVFGASITELIKRELLEESRRNIKLTSKGLDFANDVFMEFLR